MTTISAETNNEMRTRFLPLAKEIVADARRHGGLAALDIERFWADQALAAEDPFGADILQVPLGIQMTRECVFAELGIPENWYCLYHDPAWVVSGAFAAAPVAEIAMFRR